MLFADLNLLGQKVRLFAYRGEHSARLELLTWFWGLFVFGLGPKVHKNSLTLFRLDVRDEVRIERCIPIRLLDRYYFSMNLNHLTGIKL